VIEYKLETVDLQKYLTVIDDYVTKVDRVAIKIGLDFTNKIGGFGNRSQSVYSSRDSLLYRLGAIRQHLLNYSGLRTEIEGQLNTISSFSVTPWEALRIGKHYSYQFDDLIFNLVSFLDYLGRLIAETLNSGKINDWPGLVKASGPKSNNPFNKLKISKIILDFDSNVTNKLYEYRSELIHEKAHNVNVNLTHKSNEPTEITPFAPTGFVSKFHELRKLKNSGTSILLDNAIQWLISNYFTYVIKVMGDILADIEVARTIEKGHEPIKFKGTLKQE
jgi:hypothetical protein